MLRSGSRPPACPLRQVEVDVHFSDVQYGNNRPADTRRIGPELSRARAGGETRMPITNLAIMPTGIVDSKASSGARSMVAGSQVVRSRRLTAVAILALSSVVLSACAPGLTPEGGAPTPVSTVEEDNSTFVEGERYESGDFERSDPLPENLKFLEAALPETFVEAPREDQLAWASWVMQYEQQFADMFYSVSTRPTDTTVELTKDSDLAALMQNKQWVHRVAFNLGTGEPRDMQSNGALDKNRIIKLLAAYMDGDQLVEAQKLYENMNSYMDGQSLNVVTQSAKNVFNLAENIQKATDLQYTPISITFGEQQVNAWDYSYTDPDDQTPYSGVAVLYEYTNYKGEASVAGIS